MPLKYHQTNFYDKRYCKSKESWHLVLVNLHLRFHDMPIAAKMLIENWLITVKYFLLEQSLSFWAEERLLRVILWWTQGGQNWVGFGSLSEVSLVFWPGWNCPKASVLMDEPECNWGVKVSAGRKLAFLLCSFVQEDSLGVSVFPLKVVNKERRVCNVNLLMAYWLWKYCPCQLDRPCPRLSLSNEYAACSYAVHTRCLN